MPSAPTLLRHGREVTSLFQLLGEHENDLTASVAWALGCCPTFLSTFLRLVLGRPASVIGTEVRIQNQERGAGVTDIEIESPGRFFVVIEAKRGWVLPSRRQLAQYAAKRSLALCRSPKRCLAVLSECTEHFAVAQSSPAELNGVPVRYVTWRSIASLAAKARNRASINQRYILNQLLTYLTSVISLPSVESNLVYVVALSGETPDGWNISFKDVVNKRRRYFHPVGINGWPKIPPNYIAFRYEGRLRSIHHVDHYEVVARLSERFPEIPTEAGGPYFVYRLGVPFSPAHVVTTGKVFPNGRVWCMLDTLLTCKTVAEARDLTRDRRQRAELGSGR
jgi:hypothetical protein